MYRGNYSARPETRTVPADLPAALLVAPLGRRNPEDALRLVSLDVLTRVKDLKIASDDLICPIPLDPLCSGVPTDHTTLRVEHKNGVILNSLNQQSKALSGLPLGHDALPEPRKDQAGDYPEYYERYGSDLI